MNINLNINLQDNNLLTLYDNSYFDTLSYSNYPENNFNLYKVEVKVSSNLAEGVYTFDCIDYMSNGRDTTEILKLTANQIGIVNNENIFLDGVYTFEYFINDFASITKKIVIFANVKPLVEQFLTDNNYSIKVGSYNFGFIGDEADNHFEQCRVIKSLYDGIILYATNPDEDSEATIIDDISKLQRILNI